jgi:hypothetical protein
VANDQEIGSEKKDLMDALWDNRIIWQDCHNGKTDEIFHQQDGILHLAERAVFQWVFLFCTVPFCTTFKISLVSWKPSLFMRSITLLSSW